MHKCISTTLLVHINSIVAQFKTTKALCACKIIVICKTLDILAATLNLDLKLHFHFTNSRVIMELLGTELLLAYFVHLDQFDNVIANDTVH